MAIDWNNTLTTMNVETFLTEVAQGGKLKFGLNKNENPTFKLHYGDEIAVAFKLFGKFEVLAGSMSASVYDEAISGEEFDPANYEFAIVGNEGSDLSDVKEVALKLKKAPNLDISDWSDLF